MSIGTRRDAGMYAPRAAGFKACRSRALAAALRGLRRIVIGRATLSGLTFFRVLRRPVRL
jgi:hypothetical protein